MRHAKQRKTERWTCMPLFVWRKLFAVECSEHVLKDSVSSSQKKIEVFLRMALSVRITASCNNITVFSSLEFIVFMSWVSELGSTLYYCIKHKLFESPAYLAASCFVTCLILVCQFWGRVEGRKKKRKKLVSTTLKNKVQIPELRRNACGVWDMPRWWCAGP